MRLILKHQTPEQFRARLREDFRASERDRTVHLADFITARIAAGDMTDAAMRAQFGLTNPQWVALKARMNNLVNSRRALRGAVGE